MGSLANHPLSDKALVALAADMAVANGPPAGADPDEIGPATAALWDWCAEHYQWASDDLWGGAYIGWRDALRAVAAVADAMGPFAFATLAEEWQSEAQQEAGVRMAAEIVARWRANQEEAGR